MKPLFVLLLAVACKGEPTPLPTPTAPTPVTGAPWDCESEPDTAAPDITGWVRPDMGPGLTLLDLGVQQTSCGFSEPVTFEVPEGTTSFTLVLIGHPDTITIPAALVDPEGGLPIDFDPEGGATIVQSLVYGPFASLINSPNRVLPISHVRAVTVPNNDTVTVIPGTYSLEIGAWRVDVANNGIQEKVGLDNAVHAFVILKSAIEDAGELDLTFHLSGSGGITAANALSHDGFTASLDTMRTAYASAGITVDEVQVVDLPPGFDQTLPLDSPSCTTSAELLELMADGDPGALNFYVIPRLTCASAGNDLGDFLAGISIGVPGVPWSSRDGVLLLTDLLDEYPDAWPKIGAHESGHFLGLFHTVESVAALQDPIADTDDNPDNLMFWSVLDSPNAVFSPEQGRVLRNNPLVRPVATGK